MNKTLIATTLIPFVLTLTACGGGGGSSEPDTPTPVNPTETNGADTINSSLLPPQVPNL